MKFTASSIKFEGVTKKFGSVKALDDVSFEIKRGEFVFITGPSGAGKTTITKLILREYLPTEGVIEIGDTDLTKLSKGKIPELRRKIGVVFQDFRLLSERTVFENVALPLEVAGMGREDIKKNVLEMLDLVGLEERGNFFPAQLAGGEMQRVCLARAIVASPELILADEPTGNLDPTTSWQIVKLLKKINKMGTTVLMSTHNVDIVNSLNEKVIDLNKGQVLKVEDQGKYAIT